MKEMCTSILNYIIQTKDSLKEFVKSEVKYDEEIDSWLFVNKPWPVLGIIIVYLLFVMKIGPKMMENRQPYNITNVILVFNFLQFSYNGLLCLWILLTPGIPKYIFTHLCHITNETQHERYLIKCLHTVSWFYFMSKIIDLLDTVFFVLRKKQSHVSFLHVYHHTKMVISCWIHLRFFKSEQAAYGAWLNSSVHIAMYGYYFLAALGPYMQKYLWWKVYVTRLQIAQLFIAVAYMAYLYKYDCTMPRALAFTVIIDLFAFIYLFMDFYKSAYKDEKINIIGIADKNDKEDKIDKIDTVDKIKSS
ncbi:elongation of very long chain fatty acids protein 4-like [Myzus persicae]|uniref:elongation of very long chain fatty acids protein 4-like n=1 Tax=Myzus persicae TaxID=13164 RepID=UPI000B9337B0|nr:elongation of very long chain fatty acids protein 4-like [Myzus persicae]XP_022177771.1 elongation of very long chain fatty acids protein 4-like [Myzus persicae]XP_022177772.1 elongation of very long chain fatty acids protein 4-like [Myzus persicae]XP_022177773.1 elongation of very long chain fatty acids protein 4-like [Myzus persicae]